MFESKVYEGGRRLIKLTKSGEPIIAIVAVPTKSEVVFPFTLYRHSVMRLNEDDSHKESCEVLNGAACFSAACTIGDDMEYPADSTAKDQTAYLRVILERCLKQARR